ncbi:MAG: filamentous hemagglutinin N-terminal domain-containing protein [Burkholderiales bacterium]
MKHETAVALATVRPSAYSPRVPAGFPRRSAIAAAVASCFAASTVLANPTGMSVASGSATASVSGNTLSITNSPGAILNWQAFSIGQNEVTRFLQQSAASAVLNRVTGGNPSQILGTLQSNGRVFLINPNGIVFGAGSQVNVAGLVASTLNLSNEDFLAGRMRFTQTPGAGSLVNEGTITTPRGGKVYLVAPQVVNSGIINAPNGDVILAAGKSVELVSPGISELRVEVSAPEHQALNMGQIIADSGRIGIYAGLVRNSGVIRADSAVVGENGQIILKATVNTTLEAGSVLSASGPTGGSITVHSGDTTIVAGAIEATGSAGAGGSVQVLGNLVGLAGTASIDASGQTGGGSVLVGGDFQGQNPEVQNAFRTFVADGAVIKADALASGDGGKVIVWADDITRFYGSISARGGANSGDGGFVEISGKRLLDFNGRVDVGAANGAVGTILFDPDTITIVQGTGADDEELLGPPPGVINFADGGEGANFVFGEAALEALSGNVILQANRDITIDPGLSGGLAFTTSGQSFTAEAGRHITVNSAITTTDGAINLTAGVGPAPDASATLTVNADLTSGNGLIRLESAGSGGIVVGGGATVYSLNGVTLQADKLSLAGANQIRGQYIAIWPWNNSDITLGGTGSGLSITQADADKFKTDGGELFIGDYLRTYGIHLAGALSFDSGNVAEVHLYAGNGSITQSGGAPITVSQLAVEAPYGTVNMPAANRVDVLAGYARGSFAFTNAQELTVDYIGGVDGVRVDGGEGGHATINIATTSGALHVHQPVVAYAYDGGEGGTGGSATITLTGAGGVDINAYAGGKVLAFAASNDTGGAATVTISGGSGGVAIQGEGGEGYGTVQAEGGYGYYGDGGAASVTITSTGSSSIMLDSTSIKAWGGGSDYYNGGAATVAMTSGTGGIASNYSSVEASGGYSYYGAGGAASLTMNGGSGGVSIYGDGAEGAAAVYARGGDSYYEGDGGAASVAITASGSGSITVDNASILAIAGDSNYNGNGGAAQVLLTTTGSGAINVINSAYVEANGGEGGDGSEGGGHAGNALVQLTAGSGGITIDNAVVIAATGDGGEGFSGSGGNGGNAQVQLTATGSGGITITNAGVTAGAGDGGEGSSGGNGGNATVTLTAGSGDIAISSTSLGAYGGQGGDGYFGTGGAAVITITSTGSSSIILDSTSIAAVGGYSDYYNGGAATVAMTSGTGGISSNYSYVEASGGNAYDGAGGAASITMNGGSGGVSIYGDGGEGAAVYARGGDSYYGSGGAASVAITASGSGSITVDNASILAIAGDSNYNGNGGAAEVILTATGTGAISVINSAYVEANGGDGGDGSEGGGHAGNALVQMTAGSGGITIDNAVVNALTGDGGEGFSGSGGNGGNAKVELIATGSGGITITNAEVTAGAGDGGEGFSGNGGHGGNAQVQLTAGSGGITIASAGLYAYGGGGGDGDGGEGTSGGNGGNALIALSTSGGISFGSTLGAYGGYSGGGDSIGGAGRITLNAGADGVALNAGSFYAYGGEDSFSGGDGSVNITTGGSLFLNATIYTQGGPNSGSSSGIFLNANRIDGGEGVLVANWGQLIKLTAVNGIGDESNPVRIDTEAPDVEAHNSSSGDVALAVVNGDINIDNFPVTNSASGGGIFIIAESGNINVFAPTANPNGAITLRSKLSGGTITIDGGEGSVTSGGGRDVYLYADNMDIFGPVRSSSGFVTASVVTSGREIWLGSSGGGGSALELSDAELNNMTAIGGSGGGLIIGQTGDTPIIIKGPISPSAYPNLYGTTLTQDPGATVTGGISMSGTGNVTLTDPGNMITLFGANTPGNASVTTLSDLLLGDINIGGNLAVDTAGALNTWSLSGPLNVGGSTALVAVNGIGTASDPLRTTSSGAGFTATNTGAGGINVLSSAATFTVGGGGASFDNSGGGSYQIQSTGNMNVSGTLATDADAIFAAAGILNVSGYNSGFDAGFSGAAVNFSGGNTTVAGALNVVAGDLNVTNVTVSGGTVSVLASNLNVVSTGGTADFRSTGGNFTGIIGNNINVTGGMAGGNARIYGSPDVDLTVGGAINLTANAGTAKIEADLPTTIRVLFPLRAGGGYFVNGVENVVWDDLTSTGFFAGGAPAILGSSLLISYGSAGLSGEVLAAINFINGERQRAVDLGILPEDDQQQDDKKAPGICR